MFRNRTYTASLVSTFFASFAFFGAVIFIPRWLQIVQGFTPTWSGLGMLPLMVGLIGSSIVSGFIVARTGRYKWLVVGAIALMGISTVLFTQLRADTSLPVAWAWMFVAGLGVGPTFSVFTIIVQNAVPFHQLGTATANLTFFRQIGGTVALTIVGTIFGTEFQNQIGPQLTAAGVPDQIRSGFAAASSGGGLDFNQLTGTGDLGQTILAGIPAAFRAGVEPFIGNIVDGIHRAFSLGVATTFWVGVGASLVAALAAAAMRELPLRQQTTAEMVAERQRHADKNRPLPAAD
jgi:Na+/melibiose symporter-like transporter